MSTSFERMYLMAEPFIPVLSRQVRARLQSLAKTAQAGGPRPRILDVGGRKSPYTIDLAADVTVSDIPRQSDVQHQLHLGVDAQVVRALRARRSNIAQIVFDDMTASSFRDATFDCVVAIEVLEHVPCDREFLREVYRVLRPGGSFLMTTPNGDFVPNHNPDHCRHYRYSELDSVLRSIFDNTAVSYAVRSSRFYSMGLRSWSVRKPLQTVSSMLGNVVSGWESRPSVMQRQAEGSQHLLAVAHKAPVSSHDVG